MKEIPLTQGKVALVDDEDYDFLMQWKWCSHKRRGNYAAVRRKNKTEFFHMHRIIFGKDTMIDHINGDPLDNRKCNLRECDFSQNAANKTRQSNNKSGYKGVSFRPDKKLKQWSAEIHFRRVKKRLGYFLTPEEAHEAYKKAALELHGEFAKW